MVSFNIVCNHWPVQTKLRYHFNGLKIKISINRFPPQFGAGFRLLGLQLLVMRYIPELTLRPLPDPGFILPENRPQ